MSWKAIIGVALACLVGMTALAADEADGAGRVWFGLGGSTVGVAFPDLAVVNTLLTDRGYGALGETVLFTGGRARGGVIGGLSLGGIGWGGEMAAVAENRYAELAIGFGGIEAGGVLGGDERTLLTLGAVLGGGGTSMVLLEDAIPVDAGEEPYGTCGVIPEPLIFGRYSVFLAIEPFISLQVQPLHYLGFELHLGYLFPIASYEWGDAELEGATPKLSGPVVSLSATWGAIGRPAIGPILERPEVEETVDQSVSLSGPCVDVNNGIGSISVETTEDPDVRIVAVKRAHSQTMLDQVSILIEPTRCGLTVHSKGPRNSYWEIDYTVFVPMGTEVSATQGAGDIVLRETGGKASIELGVGEVEVTGRFGPSLAVQSGAGHVRLFGVVAEEIDVELGTGDVEVLLPSGAAYAIDAGVGIGEIAIGPFEGLDAIEAGGLGSHVEATLGDGSGRLSIDLGVGEIHVRSVAE